MKKYYSVAIEKIVRFFGSGQEGTDKYQARSYFLWARGSNTLWKGPESALPAEVSEESMGGSGNNFVRLVHLENGNSAISVLSN